MIRFSLFFLIALLWPATVFAQIEPPHPNYVGTQACVECHGDVVRSWETSHHALAWTEAREDTVLGDFENAEHAQGGTLSRFTTKDEKKQTKSDHGAIAPLRNNLAVVAPALRAAGIPAGDPLGCPSGGLAGVAVVAGVR